MNQKIENPAEDFFQAGDRQVNPDNPNATKHAVIDYLTEGYKDPVDGKYHLKLCYPGLYNDDCFEFKQENHPFDSISVSGFQVIKKLLEQSCDGI